MSLKRTFLTILFYKINILVIFCTIFLWSSTILQSEIVNKILKSYLHTKDYLLKSNKKEIKDKFYINFIDTNKQYFGFWTKNDDLDLSIFIQRIKDESRYRVVTFNQTFEIDRKYFENKLNGFYLRELGSKNSNSFFKFVGDTINAGFDIAIIFYSSNYFDLIGPLYIYNKHNLNYKIYNKFLYILNQSKIELDENSNDDSFESDNLDGEIKNLISNAHKDTEVNIIKEIN